MAKTNEPSIITELGQSTKGHSMSLLMEALKKAEAAKRKTMSSPTADATDAPSIDAQTQDPVQSSPTELDAFENPAVTPAEYGIEWEFETDELESQTENQAPAQTPAQLENLDLEQLEFLIGDQDESTSTEKSLTSQDTSPSEEVSIPEKQSMAEDTSTAEESLIAEDMLMLEEDLLELPTDESTETGDSHAAKKVNEINEVNDDLEEDFLELDDELTFSQTNDKTDKTELADNNHQLSNELELSNHQKESPDEVLELPEEYEEYVNSSTQNFETTAEKQEDRLEWAPEIQPAETALPDFLQTSQTLPTSQHGQSPTATDHPDEGFLTWEQEIFADTEKEHLFPKIQPKNEQETTQTETTQEQQFTAQRLIHTQPPSRSHLMPVLVSLLLIVIIVLLGSYYLLEEMIQTQPLVTENTPPPNYKDINQHLQAVQTNKSPAQNPDPEPTSSTPLIVESPTEEESIEETQSAASSPIKVLADNTAQSESEPNTEIDKPEKTVTSPQPPTQPPVKKAPSPPPLLAEREKQQDRPETPTEPLTQEAPKGIKIQRNVKQNQQLNQQLTQAYQAFQRKEDKTALRLYQKILQTYPRNRDALLATAALALRKGNTGQAVQTYRQILKYFPQDSVAQAGLINALQTQAPAHSESQLKILIDQQPQSAFLHFNLGSLYARQNRWRKAQQAYFNAYQHQPDQANYAYNLAVSLEHLHQPSIALHYYQKALQLARKQAVNFDLQQVQKRVDILAKQTQANFIGTP